MRGAGVSGACVHRFWPFLIKQSGSGCGARRGQAASSPSRTGISSTCRRPRGEAEARSRRQRPSTSRWAAASIPGSHRVTSARSARSRAVTSEALDPNRLADRPRRRSSTTHLQLRRPRADQVPGFCFAGRMAITQDRTRRLALPEGARASLPGCGRASTVLHDLLSQHPLTGHQQNLRQNDPAVLTVERGHRILVALADPAQQPSVLAGRIVTCGEGCCADVPVRIVHL